MVYTFVYWSVLSILIYTDPYLDWNSLQWSLSGLNWSIY